MNFKIRNVIVLTTIFILVACNGSDNKNDKNNSDAKGKITEESSEKENIQKLEGAWEIIRAEGIAARTNVGTVYTFYGDELIMGKGGLNNPGKTEITDSTFSFQSEGIDYKFLYNYSFKGDTLVTSMENSNGQMFYMIKK